MKTADEYAKEAEEYANADLIDEGWMAKAQVYATLALVAATLEASAADRVAAEMDRLDAAINQTPKGELGYDPCLHSWHGCTVGESENHVCDLVVSHTQARHHCICGAISR